MMAGKGEEAVEHYVVAAGERNIHNHINQITNQIASGGRKGIYAPGAKLLPHLGELGDVVEKEGVEAAIAFAKQKWTSEYIDQDLSMLPESMGSKVRGVITGGGEVKAAEALKSIKAMEAAGARTGVMSKKTLLNIIKAGKTALKVVDYKAGLVVDQFV
jgi:hypothetical protein